MFNLMVIKKFMVRYIVAILKTLSTSLNIRMACTTNDLQYIFAGAKTCTINRSYLYILLLLGSYLRSEEAIQVKSDTPDLSVDLIGNNIATPIKIVCLNDDAWLYNIANRISYIVNFDQQLNSSVSFDKDIKKRGDIKKLFEQGFCAVIYLTGDKESNFIEWRLYDSYECEMVKGRRHDNVTENSFWINVIANDIFKELIGYPSIFAYCLAYIKTYKNDFAQRLNDIYVCNIDRSMERRLTRKSGFYTGLSWSGNIKNPNLFFSEFTKYNVRLCNLDMNRNKRIIIDSPGTFVGLSMSPDSKKGVYCKSGKIYSYIYDSKTFKGKHRLLISNNGRNTCPNLLDNGDIVFCSDSKELTGTTLPKICKFIALTGKIEVLTENGFCVGPHTHKDGKIIVYSKKINGFFQIFTYDYLKKIHVQQTFDSFNKIDSCLSECGNYVFYCLQHAKKSQIACLSLKSGKQIVLTDGSQICSMPACSPIYTNFYFLLN